MARRKRKAETIGTTGEGEPIQRAPMPDLETVPEVDTVAPPPPPSDPSAVPEEAGPGAGKRRGRPKGSRNRKAPPMPTATVIGFYTETVRGAYGMIGMMLRDPASFDVPEEHVRTMIATPLAAIFPDEEIDPRIMLAVGLTVITGGCVASHLAHRKELRKAALRSPPANPPDDQKPAGPPTAPPAAPADASQKTLAQELAEVGAGVRE